MNEFERNEILRRDAKNRALIKRYLQFFVWVVIIGIVYYVANEIYIEYQKQKLIEQFAPIIKGLIE